MSLIRAEEEGEEDGGEGEEEGGVVSEEEVVVGVASEVGAVEEEEPVRGEYRTSLFLNIYSVGYNYSFFLITVTLPSQLTLHVFPVYPLTPFTPNNIIYTATLPRASPSLPVLYKTVISHIIPLHFCVFFSRLL